MTTLLTPLPDQTCQLQAAVTPASEIPGTVLQPVSVSFSSFGSTFGTAAVYETEVDVLPDDALPLLFC